VKEVDRSVVFFMNKDYYEPTHVMETAIAQNVVPYTNLYQMISTASPDVATHEIFPAFRTPENDTFGKICQAIKTAIQPEGRHFVYAYWDKVDSLMHEFGPYAPEVHEMIETVETGFADLVINSPDDTIYIVIADHGQVDVDPILLYEYPDIMELLVRRPSVESRAAVFYIKKDMDALFVDRFNLHFRKYFNLYKTEDALKMKLFGVGHPHPRTREFLGDFIAIATDHFNLVTQKDSFIMKGQHAGLLEAEMMVPLIIHSPKK
jgi:predicted AlkP superfamily pyrophosphatase or phosphodiesterase